MSGVLPPVEQPPLRLYRPSPILADFMWDNSAFRGVMGPFGSGKSVACCIEIYRRARMQAPWNGVRKSKWAVIRNSYRQLKSTTVATWRQWYSPGLCPIVYGSPITGKFQHELPDGTFLDAEVLFFPLDKPSDIDNVLSLELTGVYFNEAREISLDIVISVLGRLGRYPSRAEGGASWWGGWADTNPPHTKHWWYELAEVKKPKNFKFWRQPGGLKLIEDQGGKKHYIPNPEAENIKNLPGGYQYYNQFLEAYTPEWLKVHVLAEYGNVFAGQPVYLDLYIDSVHCPKDGVEYLNGLPLHLGWDFGLTPACIVGQLSPTGQLRIIKEFVCKRGGIRQFVRDDVAPGLKNAFGTARIATSTGDPSGEAGAQGDIEVSAIGELKKLGFQTEEAPTNAFTARRQAVIEFLTRTIGGNTPAFLLDKGCTMLREGFLGGYHYAQIQASGDAKYREMPEKNEYSHPHDALQYLCLALDPTHQRANLAGAARPPRNNWRGRVG